MFDTQNGGFPGKAGCTSARLTRRATWLDENYHVISLSYAMFMLKSVEPVTSLAGKNEYLLKGERQSEIFWAFCVLEKHTNCHFRRSPHTVLLNTTWQFRKRRCDCIMTNCLLRFICGTSLSSPVFVMNSCLIILKYFIKYSMSHVSTCKLYVAVAMFFNFCELVGGACYILNCVYGS